MGRVRQRTPKVDTEVASPRAGATSAGLVSDTSRSRHVRRQAEARAHDALIESMGTTRATKDRDRIYPRAGQGDVRPRRGRHALAPDEPRLPLSPTQAARQQHTKRLVQDKMPKTEKVALARLVRDRDSWESLNTALIDQGRGKGRLVGKDKADVQRVDRAIRRFEQANDRTHRVYTAMDLDREILDNPEQYLQAGDRYTLDGFTAGSHSADQVTGRTVMEITGSRGMYLGGSDPSAGALHLLPRGVTLEIDGVSDAAVVTSHGAVRRTIVQAHVVEETTA